MICIERQYESVDKAGGRCTAGRFTLLELLIAVAVFILLTTVLAAALTTLTASWRRILRENDRLEKLAVLDRTLDRMLSGTAPFVWRDQEGLPFTVFRGEPDRLFLTYRHRAGSFEDGGIRFAALSVRDDRLVAEYMERPPESLNMLPVDMSVSVLAEDVDRIECLYGYVDPETGLRWIDEWDTENRDGEIPLAVAVHVYWLDGAWECWLRRTNGAGLHERAGDWRRPRGRLRQ